MCNASMFYQCEEGGCIQYSFVCDGTSHCLDGSDEWCTQYTKIQNATADVMDYTHCRSGDPIVTKFINDLIPDCPGVIAEDEPEYQVLLTNNEEVEDKCQPGYLPCVLGHSKCFPIYVVCLYDLDE